MRGEGCTPLNSNDPLRSIPPTPSTVSVVVATSSSSFLRPADPPPPEARNEAEDSANIPREAYREEDIVHDNDDNGDD